MNPHLWNWIFGLIAVTAIAAAVFIWITHSSTPIIVPSPSPTPISSATPSISPSSFASPSPGLSPSPSPSLTRRTFTASQGLAVVNQTDTIQSGDSLLTIATKHNVDLQALANLNGISDVNTVYAGQTVIIPDDASDNAVTVLFVQNNVRLAGEQAKVQAGAKSIYSDSVTAAQADAKGLYGIATDTPFSKSNDSNDTTTTLSTTISNHIITINLTKITAGFWLIQRVTVRTTTPSPSPTSS